MVREQAVMMVVVVVVAAVAVATAMPVPTAVVSMVVSVWNAHFLHEYQRREFGLGVHVARDVCVEHRGHLVMSAWWALATRSHSHLHSHSHSQPTDLAIAQPFER